MELSEQASRPAVAVVGVSALFPGTIDSTGFWADILAGTDRMTEVPPSHWLVEDYYDSDIAAHDKTYGRRGGFLETMDLDVMGFGIPPVDVPSTDTAQLLALIVAQRVLADATEGQFSELDRSRVSVILGVTSGQELLGAMASRMNRPLWLQGMRRAGVAEDAALAACEQIAALHPEWSETTFPGLLGNVVAGRIANRLDLGGTNCVTDAACASSFSALSMGINELYLGDSDLVIAGGVDTMNDIFMYMCFSKTPALSQTEDVRPFSDQADGTMLGEGIGMVALKRLADAERDGNHIYCVVNGVGASSDGRSKSVYAPVSSGQARALSNAYAKTAYSPDSVELVEAHGTGTVAGDAAEFGGLEIAFNAAGRQDRQWCALGSVKSQIGHTKAAAGAAGLFKVIMALHHKVLPQTAKIDQPNPKLDLVNSPFYLNTQSRPWVRGTDHERRGSVSSFGFGGSNFHVALSEYTGDGPRPPRLRTSDSELVVLCGRDGADIVAQARSHQTSADIDGYLAWLAQSSQLAYDASAPARLAFVATGGESLQMQLAEAIKQVANDPGTAFSSPTKMNYGVGEQEGDIAFVFPGQGSQYLFMGADLAMQYREALEPWDLAADLDWDDTSLHDVVYPQRSFDEHADKTQRALLTATQWAQPAIGVTSLAILKLLQSIGVEADHLGGHSFGEITALHAAGVLGDTDMLRVSRRRGDLMAEAAQSPGSMTAVAHEIGAIRTIVEQSGIDVVVANHNSHTQVVLSGVTNSIEQIESVLAGNGIRFKRLDVATAFHSPVVSGASGAFTTFLDGIVFTEPHSPVYANETAEPYPTDDLAMRSQLGRQLANPVRFVEMIQAMHDKGARTFVEVGPSSTLTGLVKKILKGQEHTAVPLDNNKSGGVGAFLAGLGQLVALGVSINFSSLWAEYGDPVNPTEVQQPKLTIGINGANYGSPYPPQDLSELATPNTERTSVNVMTQPEPTIPTNTEARQPAPAVPTPVAPAPVSVGPPAGVLSAYQAVQRQTANAHAEYLRSMAEVHSSFLDAAQQSIAILGQIAGGAIPSAVPAIVPATVVPSPGPVAAPTVPPIPLENELVDATPPASAMPAAPATPAVTVVAQASPPSSPATDVVEPSVASTNGTLPISTAALMDLLLAVVSDKTGYPAEMLTMEMELEADLGIDSIKRVEILSAMQDQVPELPEVDMGVMAELITLAQIVDYMGGQTVAPTSTPDVVELVTELINDPTAAAPEVAGRFVHQIVDAPATGETIKGLQNGKLAIIDGGSGIGSALLGLLNSAGVDAEMVESVPTSAHVGAIHLGGLGEFADIDEALSVNRDVFAAARELARSQSSDAGPSVFVTVSDLGGAFGYDRVDGIRAWSAGLVGLARTAVLEWPDSTVRAIDIERGGRDNAAVAEAIADELLRGGTATEIGLMADGRRVSVETREVDVQQGGTRMAQDDVIVVSGGARGVTATTMIELARESSATFVLIGRTELKDEPDCCSSAPDDPSIKKALLDAETAAGTAISPSELASRTSNILAIREIHDTLASIERVGGKAHYIAVDVTDGPAITAALAEIRAKYGPITGLVHGAGILADKLIAEKTDDQFDTVFNTKVGGLATLLTATADDQLKLLCLFSSVAARTGNVGQADYAMANEILNKVAVSESSRRGPTCVVKSLGWGPWAGGMVGPELAGHFASLGVSLIQMDEGALMFTRELASPQTDQVEVVLGSGLLASDQLLPAQQVAV